MPVYLYHCRSCGKEFEALRGIGERHEQKCDCGGECEIYIGQFRAVTETVTCGGREWRGDAGQRTELAQQRASKTPGRKHGKFKPFWHEDLGPKPVYIESMRQLRKELRKHGLYNSHIGVHPTGGGEGLER